MRDAVGVLDRQNRDGAGMGLRYLPHDVLCERPVGAETSATASTLSSLRAVMAASRLSGTSVTAGGSRS